MTNISSCGGAWTCVFYCDGPSDAFQLFTRRPWVSTLWWAGLWLFLWGPRMSPLNIKVLRYFSRQTDWLTPTSLETRHLSEFNWTTFHTCGLRVIITVFFSVHTVKYTLRSLKFKLILMCTQSRLHQFVRKRGALIIFYLTKLSYSVSSCLL